MTSPFGVDRPHFKKIISLFAKRPNVREAVLFGSRAKGSHRPGSDIDIALKGDSLSQSELTKIEMDYDALYLPWKLDLVVYETIENQALREHIDRVGVKIY